MNLLINSSEFTSEATFETFDAKMNYDISTFFLSSLSDSLLQVQNFTVVQSRNRFVEAREWQDVKRQQEFKISTQRKFSQYEHVLMKAKQQELQQELQQKMKQRLSWSRDRDWDLIRARDEEQRDEEQRGEEQRGEEQRDEGQRDERAVTFSFIQTNADLFAAFHM